MDIAKLFYVSRLSRAERAQFIEAYQGNPGFNERLLVYYPLVVLNGMIWKYEQLKAFMQGMTNETPNDHFIARLQDDLDFDRQQLSV